MKYKQTKLETGNVDPSDYEMNKLSIAPNAAIAGIYSTLSCPSVIMDDAKLQQHV